MYILLHIYIYVVLHIISKWLCFLFPHSRYPIISALDNFQSMLNVGIPSKFKVHILEILDHVQRECIYLHGPDWLNTTTQSRGGYSHIIYIYLEPKWPQFLKVNHPKEGLSNQNKGQLGSRFQSILLSQHLWVTKMILHLAEWLKTDLTTIICLFPWAWSCSRQLGKRRHDYDFLISCILRKDSISQQKNKYQLLQSDHLMEVTYSKPCKGHKNRSFHEVTTWRTWYCFKLLTTRNTLISTAGWKSTLRLWSSSLIEASSITVRGNDR